MPFDTSWDLAFGDGLSSAWSDALPYVGLASGLLRGIGQSIGQRRMSREQLELERELAEQRLAFQESALNPFRFQLNQARSANLLGGMAGSSYRRPTLTPQGAYGQSAPMISGGFSFEPDPMASSAARALEGTVLRGQTKPEGKRGGIDLISLMAGTAGDDIWAKNPTAAAPAAVPRTTQPATGRWRNGRA